MVVVVVGRMVVVVVGRMVVVVVGRMVVVVFRNHDTGKIARSRKDTMIERVARESALIPLSMSLYQAKGMRDYSFLITGSGNLLI
jgi:hypothetical protein